MSGQSAIAQKKDATRSFRGQAAIEYLMTYGWAILALVIVVGILVTSGALSPSYLVSEECSMGSNLPCNVGVYNQGGETKINIGVVNGFPYRINITSLQVRSSSDSSEVDGLGSGVILDSGSNFTFSGKLLNELPADSITRFIMNVTYVSCAPEVAVAPGGCSDSPHTMSGRITARIVKG